MTATTPQIRLTDADREQVVERLQAAVGAGQLHLEEFEERLDRAYAARVPTDLAGLLDDLDASPARRAPRRRHRMPSRAEEGPPAVARLGVLVAVVALALTVSPAFFWMLWFAVPFATGGGRRQPGWGCGGDERSRTAERESLIRA